MDHSLRPDVIDREASWVCPATGEAVARIGGLVDLEAFARRQASELAADMAWFLRYRGLEVDEAKRLVAAGHPVRILGPTGGRPCLDRTRLNIRLGPDGELVGMEPG